MNTFRQFLLDEMKRRDMSVRQLAAFIDVSPTTITRAIDEQNPKQPGLDFLMKLSTATGVSLLDLIALAYPEIVQETDLDPSARVLAQLIKKLPDDLRSAVEAIVRGGVVNG